MCIFDYAVNKDQHGSKHVSVLYRLHLDGLPCLKMDENKIVIFFYSMLKNFLSALLNPP